MGDEPDFISNFHNLEGDLIGERKKSFYKLLTKPSLFLNEQLRNETLEKLKPNTYQENTFYLEALIYFKRTEKLFEILKGGNQHFATKILKQPWFFEEAFKNIDADKLVNEFLPYFAYVVRKKLLTRISRCWPEQKMDALYDALNNKYGLATAILILQKCSPGKIETALQENEIKLKPNQVLELFNKNVDTFKVYLEHYKNVTRNRYGARKIVKYVALKDPKLLLELRNSNLLCITSIGRRTTDHIIKVSKTDILKDSEPYTKFLNKAVLVKRLGSDFQIVYKQLFPKAFRDVSYHCQSDVLIKKYPKKRRWELFHQTCTEKFANKSNQDILALLDTFITKYVPPQDVLYKWAEIKYSKQDSNSDTYLKYYPIDKVIKMVKDRINITSDSNRRRDLIEILLDTCKENNDLKALEDVLQYISSRHKNESTDTRNGILRSIQDNFKDKPLNEIHWKYINEQIMFLLIHKDLRFYAVGDIMGYYLKYLVKNGKDTKEAFINYLKQLKEGDFYYSLYLNDVPSEQEINTGLCGVFSEAVKKEEENYRRYLNNWIKKMISFSESNPKNPINLTVFPEFVSAVNSIFRREHKLEHHDLELIPKVIVYNHLFPQFAFSIEKSLIFETILFGLNDQKSTWWFSDVTNKVLAKKNRDDFANELLHFYLKEVYTEYPGGNDLVLWLFKNEPKTVLPYFDLILKACFKDDYSYCLDNKLLLHYAHLGLDKRVKEFILQLINETDAEEFSKISNYIRHLYSLLTVEEFIKFVNDNYLPKKDKLDLEDVEMRNLYKIQCDIAKILGKVDEPYKMLPTVMKFTRGDYLQSSLPSLYCTFYKSPERILYSYVEQLSKQAVSVRKHAIFLSCEVLDKAHTINLLKSTKQKNISSQKHLFSATLKYFLKNPSQDLFEKLVESFATIDKNDLETLDSLKNVTIPKKYKSQYIEKCWYFFESLEASDVKIDDYLKQLVTCMSDITSNLDPKFIDYVIKKYFVGTSSFRIASFEDFVIQVLVDRVPDRTQNFNMVFELLISLSPSLINTFFEAFLSVALKEDADKDFVVMFAQYWRKNFTIIKTLKAYISLNLATLKLGNVGIDTYAQSVVKYMDELITELSFLVFSVFVEQVNSVLDRLEEEERYRFYLGVLKYRVDANTCVLVMQLMSAVDEDDTEELRDLYTSIMGILKQVDIPIVIAYYKSYLAKNETE